MTLKCRCDVNRANDSCTHAACCSFPNGAAPIMTAQILLFAGLVASLACIVDCQFVLANVDGNATEIYNITFLPLYRNVGYGFLFYEVGAVQGCSWGNTTEATVQTYFDFLGSSWQRPLAAGISSLFIASITWLWLLFFSCVAHPRIFRYGIGITILFVVVPLQFTTFAVFRSDFCMEYGCTFGRSAGFSIFAGILFIISGLLFLVMRDYDPAAGCGNRPSQMPKEEQRPHPFPSSDELLRTDGIGDAEEVEVDSFLAAALIERRVTVPVPPEEQHTPNNTSEVQAQMVVIE